MHRNRSSGEQCHTRVPHEDRILNSHTHKVACQTCHIPTYAKASATKMTWDWSSAGKLRESEPFEVKDDAGNLSYTSKKGTFQWQQNAKLEYIWFNGTAGHYLLGDAVAADKSIQINSLHGSYDDPDAKIYPVKIHRGRQLYDPVHQTLIQPKLVAAEKGEGAFWKDFDWDRAAEEGMKSVGLPYSGQHTFVETEMTWPVNHEVAPKEQSLACRECHRRQNSRLADLPGFYMPARDRNAVVDGFGTAAILVTIFGIALHGGVRVFARRRADGSDA